jgi:polysaccharide pyruvyl transferase CsaB
MAYRIVLYSPDRGVFYDGRTPDETGIGGGHTSRLSLVTALAAAGHDVTAVVNCREPVRVAGVDYRPLDDVTRIECDVLIAISTGGDRSFTPLRAVDVQARLRVLYVQGVPRPGDLEAVSADYACVPSEFLRGVLVDRWGLAASRVVVVPNGLHQERFDAAAERAGPRDPFALAYIGPPEKGLDASLEVLRRLRATDERYRLGVFGGSQLWGRPPDTAPDRPGVEFHGLVGQRILIPRLFEYEYCLAPQAMEEGFGIAVQEAKRAGAIVLASAVGAFPELFRHGEDGFLIDAPHGSEAAIEQMTQLVIELGTDPARRERIRAVAMRTPWSWRMTAERFTTFCDGVLQPPAAAVPVPGPPVPMASAAPEARPLQAEPRDATPHVLIGGYYGHGNLGDEALLQAMLDEWRREIPSLSAIVVSGDPAQTRRDYGVAAVHDRDVPAIVDAAGRSDLVVLGGGGLFQDYFGLDEATLLSRVHWGLTYFAAFPAVALLMRRPFMVYAAGVGPLQTPDGMRYVRLIVERADAVTVRDAGSRDVLQSIGAPVDRVTIAADPAFLLERAADGRVEGILAESGVPRDRSGLIAIAARQWNRSGDATIWQAEIAGALDRLVERYAPSILFVPFQATAEDELTDDRIAADGIRSRMRRRDQTFVAPTGLRPADVQALFAAADLVLAMRLHGVILAANAQTPPVALAYDPKLRAVMQQLGLGEYVVDLAAVTADGLHERLTSAYLARAAIRSRLAGAVIHLRAAARQSSARAIELLRRPPPLREPSPEWIAVLQRALLDRVKRSEEMETHAETLTAQLLDAREAARTAGAVAAPVAVPAPPSRRADAGDAALTARLLAERTQELVALSAELNRVRMALARRPGYTSRRVQRAARAATGGVARGAWRAVTAISYPPYALARTAVRALLPASTRETFDRRLAHGLMTGAAHAFDRYKRTRIARYGRDLASVRAPGEPGLVSIVLPAYNGAAMIAGAIDSVLAQTYTHFELIVVNDGSTDDTARIVDAYARRDDRVRVIDQDNRTLPLALSRGIRAANGEFLTWTSCDNRLRPEFLQRMVDCLRRHPSWDMTYANLDLIGEDGEPLRGTAHYDGRQVPPGSEHIHLPDSTSELNVTANNTIGAAFLYRSRVAHLLGDYSKFRFVMEDYDYWMRANALLTVRHADFNEPVYEYRFHRGSLTSRWGEFDILRRRDGLMVFDDFRRDFYLLPALWIVDSPADTRVAALVRRARAAGHLVYERSSVPAHLPRLGIPVVFVAAAHGADRPPDPPADMPAIALRVLIADPAALPAEVGEGWDLCAVAGVPGPLPRLPRDYQGWLAAADTDRLFHAIDVRARAAHLERIETIVEAPEPPACDATVIVCTRGATDRLVATLKAVAGQVTDRRFELIVVDNRDAPDGSPSIDQALERVRGGAGAGLVRVARVACPVAGLSAARNAGLFEARGEIVCFLDDDAVPEPDWLAAIGAAFSTHPDVGVVGGHIRLTVPEPRPAVARPGWTKYWSEYLTEYEGYTEVEDWRHFPWGANWSARRIALLRIGGFRTGYGRKGNNYGGGEELVAAALIRRLGYTIAVEPAAVVHHEVDPARFTRSHIRRTIVAGHQVGHNAQRDQYLPQPAGLVPGFKPLFTHHVDEDVEAGARWLDVLYRKEAQIGLVLTELRDLLRRARTPVVDDGSTDRSRA